MPTTYQKQPFQQELQILQGFEEPLFEVFEKQQKLNN